MRSRRYLYSKNKNTLFIITKNDEEAKPTDELTVSAENEELIPLTPTDPVPLRRRGGVHPDAKPKTYVTFFGAKPAVVHDSHDTMVFSFGKGGEKHNGDLIEPAAVFTIGPK